MRHLTIIAAVLALATGCGDINATVSGQTKPVTVKGTGTGTVGSALPADAIKPTAIELGEARQYKDNLKSARLKEFRVQVESSSLEKNLDYMNSIRVVVVETVTGREKMEIAALNPVPKGQSEVSLNVNSGELRDLVVAEDNTYQILYKVDGVVPGKDSTFRGLLTFAVTAGL